jgi:hypothetical protein
MQICVLHVVQGKFKWCYFVMYEIYVIQIKYVF